MPDDDEDLLDAWLDRVDSAQLSLPLPTVDQGRMTWLHVGHSDAGINRRFLAEHLHVGTELLDWLSEGTTSPAYWPQREGGAGVRLPLELGTRGWVGADGIPEELDEHVPLLKIAVVGDHVVTSLGLNEEIDYALPAGLLLDWAPGLDDRARAGATTFAHELMREQLTAAAWYSASIQTVLDDEWRQGGAMWRLRNSVLTEAHLAELQIQHDAVTDDEVWFGQDPLWEVTLTTRALEMAMRRLTRARDLERDEIQLSLLTALRTIAESGRRSEVERGRQTEATERLTRRLTLVSVAFLPATLMCGLLGANWGTPPLPDGWTGLGVVVACVLLVTGAFVFGAGQLMRGERR